MLTYFKSVVAESVVAKSVLQSQRAKNAYLGKQPQLNQGHCSQLRHTAVLCLQVNHEQVLACLVLTQAKPEADSEMSIGSNQHVAEISRSELLM